MQRHSSHAMPATLIKATGDDSIIPHYIVITYSIYYFFISMPPLLIPTQDHLVFSVVGSAEEYYRVINRIYPLVINWKSTT
jgi:hypothetical protein